MVHRILRQKAPDISIANVVSLPDLARSADRRDSIAAAVFLFGFSFWQFTATLADPDLWGHLRFGLDMLAAGAIVRHDPYSFTTAGTEWINHEWLSEVVFALIYSAASAPGLILFKAAVGLGIVWLAWHQLSRSALPALRRLLPLLLTIPLLTMALGSVRPHLFTLAAFALTVWAICRREEGATRSLWLLPLVFLLWANFHGGFLAGAGILLLWLGVRTVVTVRRHRQDVGAMLLNLKDDTLPVTVSLLATLVNPYGVGLWTFLLRTATVPRPEITEWSPVSLTTASGAFYLVLLGTTAGAILGGSRRQPAVLAVYACLALLPLVAVRHLPLFAIGSLFIAAPLLADAGERWLGPYHPQGGRIVPALAGVLTVVVVLASVPNVLAIRVRIPSAQPARAVAMLAATRSAGRLATEFGWGEYVIWHAGPRILVSVDGRRETVYEESSYRKSMNFMYGREQWDAIVGGEKADVALVRRASPAYNLLQLKPGWSLMYEDSTAAIFAAEGSAVGAELRVLAPPDLPADGIGLSFP